MITVASELRRAGVVDTSAFEGLTMPFSLRERQVAALNQSLIKPKFGLYMEPRTGKTIVFMLNALYCITYGYRVILIVPPVLFRQIEREWLSIGNNPHTIEVFAGTAAARKKRLAAFRIGAPDLLVMTRPIFTKHYHDLLEAGYKQVIFDESHMGLQDDSSQLYARLSNFCQGKDSRLILSTGTPIYTNLTGAYPATKLTNPEAYFDKSSFMRQHVMFKNISITNRRGQRVRHKVPDRYINVEGIHANLYKNAIRVTRKETLDIKTPNIQTSPVELSPAHHKLYKDLMKTRVLEFQGRLINATQEAKLRQLALQIVTSPQHYVDGKPPENSVLQSIDALCEQFPKSEKIVIFANYTQSVETITEHLRAAGHDPAVIYGPNGTAKNLDNADRFVQDPSCTLAVINPQAGGVGLTLGHVCQTCIFAEPVSSPGAFDQALSRMLLDGQKDPVVCYILEVLSTISVKAISNMRKKALEVQQANADVETIMSDYCLS